MTLESKTFALMVTFLQQTHRAAERALQGEGITPAQFFVLRTLRARRAVTQGGLAEAMGVTAGNVSQLIAKLELANLVRRTGRGRAKEVSLTPAGARVVSQFAPHHETFLRERFAALDPDERTALWSLVQKLTSAPAAGSSRGNGPIGPPQPGPHPRKKNRARSPRSK